MRGTFLAPEEVKADVEETDRSRKILARGGDNYFVVMTLQNSVMPEVEISGKGLDAEVRVGKRMILFNGDRVIVTTHIPHFIMQ